MKKMRQVKIRDLQRKLYTEIKDLPIEVLRYGQVYFYVVKNIEEGKKKEETA